MSLLNPAGLLARIREEAGKIDKEAERAPHFKEILIEISKPWRKLESDIEAELLAEQESETPATDAAPVNGQQAESIQ